jgi:hypothetical protein
MIEQLRNGYLIFDQAQGSRLGCSFGYNKDYGDGVAGNDSGGGYGDGTKFGDSEGDGDVPGTRINFFLACSEPTNLTYTLVNALCRMEP